MFLGSFARIAGLGRRCWEAGTGGGKCDHLVVGLASLVPVLSPVKLFAFQNSGTLERPSLSMVWNLSCAL